MCRSRRQDRACVEAPAEHVKWEVQCAKIFTPHLYLDGEKKSERTLCMASKHSNNGFHISVEHCFRIMLCQHITQTWTDPVFVDGSVCPSSHYANRSKPSKPSTKPGTTCWGLTETGALTWLLGCKMWQWIAVKQRLQSIMSQHHWHCSTVTGWAMCEARKGRLWI